MKRKKTDPDAGAVAPRSPAEGEAAYASPPCFMHELDPSYLGYLGETEVIALLNRLLEGERAGARGVGELSRRAASARDGSVLREIARDEARFCAMLTRHIGRLGGRPSRETGAFYDRLLAGESLSVQLRLLDRGQGWVVRKLREALPRIADEPLHADLLDMLEVHERNIERCDRLGIESATPIGGETGSPRRRE